MEKMTAEEARSLANASGWLLNDAMGRISDAAKRNGTSVRLDVQRMSQEAVRKAEESLKNLGYSVAVSRVANEPGGDCVSMEVGW